MPKKPHSLCPVQICRSTCQARRSSKGLLRFSSRFRCPPQSFLRRSSILSPSRPGNYTAFIDRERLNVVLVTRQSELRKRQTSSQHARVRKISALDSSSQSNMFSWAVQSHAMTSLCNFQRRSRVCPPDDSRSTKDLLQLVEPSLLPVFPVALSQPPARLDQLHNIDILLERHDGQADDAKGPGNGAVHLVGAGHFHCGGGERRGEESGRLGHGG